MEQGLKNSKILPVAVVVAAGLLVYIASALIPHGDRPATTADRQQAAQPTPATDSPEEDKPAFVAGEVPEGVQIAARRFAVDYAQLTSCSEPEAALERLRALVTEGMYVQLVESRPRPGGDSCLEEISQYTLGFERGRGKVWRVVAEAPEVPPDHALYFEVVDDREPHVRYVEDPRLSDSAIAVGEAQTDW